MKERTYNEQVKINNEVKLRSLLKLLPSFCVDFFRGIEPTTASRTRIAYAYDLIVFFNWLQQANPSLSKMEMREIKVNILDNIQAIDIEEYIDYLKYYSSKTGEHTNNESAIKRKLVALRTFYKYYYKRQMIQTNPSLLVDTPKLHEKAIIRLDTDEVADLLDNVESGKGLTKVQDRFHKITSIRDLALITLLLGTGIRVSECVGIDIKDVDFKNGGIKIYRKGGNESMIYFGDEVEKALKNYLEERINISALDGHTDALFLSIQKKRISIRAVEKLVKKYSSLVTTVKNITPHKLRSTYGTSLYRETGDIYLVADVLGHKDVNTTKKHYAALEDERKRKAAKILRLRED